MKIWVICQQYKPEPGAPSARLSGLAKEWIDKGNEVTILTAKPNHPFGKIYDDYKDKPAYFSEEMDGIKIARHCLYTTPNKGFVKKAFSQLTFAFSVLFKNLKDTPASNPDIIIASSPSFFAVISGWILSKKYGTPFIFEVRDIWPGIFVELGILKNKFILWVLESIEMFLYRKANAIVVVTNGFAKEISTRGIDANKLFVITNGVSTSNLQKALTTKQDGSVEALRNELQIPESTKVMLYIGNHGTPQALGQIIDSARILVARTDVLFLFVGTGGDKERLQKISKGMPNVKFIDSQPAEKVWAFYNLATACIVPLKNIAGFSSVIPSKMFEVWATKSIVLGALRGEAAQIMENSSASLVVPPEEPKELSNAIEKLADSPEMVERMGEQGRKFVEENYSHKILAERYLSLMNKVISDFTTTKKTVNTINSKENIQQETIGK